MSCCFTNLNLHIMYQIYVSKAYNLIILFMHQNLLEIVSLWDILFKKYIKRRKNIVINRRAQYGFSVFKLFFLIIFGRSSSKYEF